MLKHLSPSFIITYKKRKLIKTYVNSQKNILQNILIPVIKDIKIFCRCKLGFLKRFISVWAVANAGESKVELIARAFSVSERNLAIIMSSAEQEVYIQPLAYISWVLICQKMWIGVLKNKEIVFSS